MRITEVGLRSIIRAVLCEQVVGYQAPSKSYDDPLGDDDHTFSSPSSDSSSSVKTDDSESDNSGSDGYMQIGDVSVATSATDTADQKKAGAAMSTQDRQQIRTQMANLSKQRQNSANSGDAKQADYLGIQMKRLKDVLNP